MKKAAEELECARKRPVIRSLLVVRELEEEEGKIAPVWALVPARGAQAVSKERHGVSRTVKSKDLPQSERTLGLDLMVILMELQEQKFPL